jgi:hypothetical protein
MDDMREVEFEAIWSEAVAKASMNFDMESAKARLLRFVAEIEKEAYGRGVNSGASWAWQGVCQ